MVQINFARHLWGLPAWAWLGILAILLIEYALPRREGARTRSILEGVANMIAFVFGRVPILGPWLKRFAGPPGDFERELEAVPPPPPPQEGEK